MTEGIPDPHGGPPYFGPQRSFGERFAGSLLLRSDVYEEVEHDAGALGQAVAVVAIAAFAHGLGASGGAAGLGPGFAAILEAILGWVAATAVIWLIGVKVLQHTSDYRELLRTTGFASAPGILAALGALPIDPARKPLAIAVFALSLFAYVIAIRQALDVATWRAIWICGLAQLVSVLIGVAVALLIVGDPGSGGAGYVP